MNRTFITESHDDRVRELYHGSPNKYTVLKAHEAQAYPGQAAVFATPLYVFALAFAGNSWSDLQINQCMYNGKHVLTEILPDQFDQCFNRPGYIHILKPDGFAPLKHHASEWICPADVKPVRIEQIPNVLEALEESATILYRYPNLPEWIPSRKKYIDEIIKKHNIDTTVDKVYKMYKINESAGVCVNRIFVTEAYNGRDTEKRIKELCDKLSKYKWGLIVDGKDISDDPDIEDKFYDRYITLSPRQVDRYKTACCWDYVLYEYEWFKRNVPRAKLTCYMFDMGDLVKGIDPANHTWLSYELPDDPTIYAMECSWKPHCGIHAFESVDDMIDRYIEWQLAGKRGSYVVIEYTPPRAGLSAKEFLNVAYRGEVVRSVGPYYRLAMKNISKG